MANRIRTPLADRFWAKVNKDGPVPEYAPNLGPCWLWTAHVGKHGYGEIGSGGKGGKTLLAHRVSYELANGPLPEGERDHHIDHLCRVTSCVNPAHLEYVTASVNSLRGLTPQVQRARGAANATCGRGHKWTPANTYWHKGRRCCRACALVRYHEKAALKRAAAGVQEVISGSPDEDKELAG